MKSSELSIKKEGYAFSCNSYPAHSHYKDVMRLGRAFPITRAQAKFFLAEGLVLDALNGDDVEIVESLLNKHGFEGKYKFTQSKAWVRLKNQNDLRESLRLEYSL